MTPKTSVTESSLQAFAHAVPSAWLLFPTTCLSTSINPTESLRPWSMSPLTMAIVWPNYSRISMSVLSWATFHGLLTRGLSLRDSEIPEDQKSLSSLRLAQKLSWQEMNGRDSNWGMWAPQIRAHLGRAQACSPNNGRRRNPKGREGCDPQGQMPKAGPTAQPRD